MHSFCFLYSENYREKVEPTTDGLLSNIKDCMKKLAKEDNHAV